LGRPHRIQQLAAGDEHDSGAGEREQPSAPAGVGFQIDPAAIDGPDGDRIDDQPRLPARLDREQPANLLQHRQSLTFERVDGCFARFNS
jgi:hypothetical protein